MFRKAFPGRSEMIDYCKVQGINVEASASKPYSMDRNLLHISYEAGILEDPWFDPTVEKNKSMYKLTTALRMPQMRRSMLSWIMYMEIVLPLMA